MPGVPPPLPPVLPPKCCATCAHYLLIPSTCKLLSCRATPPFLWESVPTILGEVFSGQSVCSRLLREWGNEWQKHKGIQSRSGCPSGGFCTATHNKNKNKTKWIPHCRQMLNWKENFFFNVGIGTRKKISKQQASIFSCVFLATANRCLRRRKSRVAAAAAVVVADDGRVPLRRVEVPFLLPHDKDITSWSSLVASAVSFFFQNKQTKTK